MNKIEKTGNYAALLSLIEVSLGSFLHSLRLPLSGQILSLNQIFLLNHAVIHLQNYKSPVHISTISAILKSFSPAGKKLTPMLALTAQGHLFSWGILLFGNHILGRLIGSILSSLWAFIQPLLIYLILFGKDIVFMLDYFQNKLNSLYSFADDFFISLFLGLILIKVLFAIAIAIIANKISETQINTYLKWLQNKQRNKILTKTTSHSPLLGALKDLFSPLYLFSFVLLCIFFFYSRGNYSTMIWNLLRPVAVGFILFYCLRAFPIERLVAKIKNKKYSLLLAETLKRIKNEK